MSDKEEDRGCVQPAAGPLVDAGGAEPRGAEGAAEEEARMVTARVGREAIDFEANAWVEGKGFETVKLSDYRGKWIVLCFYPGDFTFV